MPKFSAVVFAAESLVGSGRRALVERAEGLFRAAGVADVRSVDPAAGLPAFPPEAEAVFLAPLSCALVRPGTPAALMERFAADAAAAGCRPAVLSPTFAGRRGRPVLAAAAALAESKGETNDFDALVAGLAARGGGTDVPVADANVLFAAQADPAETRRRAERLDIPTPAEAGALWDIKGMGPRLRAHCRGVADAASAMARALKAHGSKLDLELVESAALLHDVCKGEPGHAKAGAALLDRLGFGRAAAIVAVHGDVRSADAPRIAERELVYLADKMVSGDRPVTVEERFAEKIARRPESREFNLRRLAESQALTARIEAAVGVPMARIIARRGDV